MTRHPWKAGAIVGALLGLVVAGLIMYIAGDHNAQGEIHNEFGVSWGYWLGLGLSWFALVAVPASAVVGTALSLAAYVRRRGAV